MVTQGSWQVESLLTMKRFILLVFLAFSTVAPAALCAEEILSPAHAVGTPPLGLPPIVPADSADRPLIDYGEFLFSSRLLSADQSLSCSSCHIAKLGYADSHALAVGINGAIGRRRAPPLFNLFNAKALMLDGRAAGLDDQIHIPLESPTEMAITWQDSLGRLKDAPETKHLLASRPKAVLDRSLVLSALAAYARTLVAGDSAFDRYYFSKDDAAISDEAKEGLRLFVRKGRCSGCHQVTGVSAMFTDHNFHSTGIGFADGKYADEGRFEVTRNETDKGAFKTPTLRNVALRPYFMHDGSLDSLRAVIDYYNRGGNRGAPNLDGRIQPLYLTEPEIKDILAFLGTLDSEVVSYRPWLKSAAAGQ
jgi:cytochrome c peroxidase